MKSLYIKYKYLLMVMLALSGEVTLAQNRRMGDNLGNHKATQSLNMNGKDVYNINGLAIGVAAVENSAIALQVGPATAGTKAMVIPRVNDLLNPTTPSIPSVMAIDGMMVFNNADRLFYVRQNSAWVSFGTMSLASGNIFVGNAENTAQSRTLSGDATINSNGVLTISPNAVTTAKILDANVTAGKIADLNITTAKLAANAVTTEKITDLNITAAKLAANAVTTEKIADLNVTPGKIALPDASMLIGNAAGAATAQVMTGDVSMDRLGNTTIGSATRGTNKVLTINNGGTLNWANRSEFASSTLNSAQILVGNATNVATATTLSGDVTINNAGLATIATASKGNNKVLTTDVAGATTWIDKSVLSGMMKTVATYTGNPFTAANTAVTITVPVPGLKVDDGLVVNIKTSDATAFDYIMILSSHAEDNNMILKIADMRPLPDDGVYVKPNFTSLNFIATSYLVQ
jgi:hypothetical protein